MGQPYDGARDAVQVSRGDRRPRGVHGSGEDKEMGSEQLGHLHHSAALGYHSHQELMTRGGNVSSTTWIQQTCLDILMLEFFWLSIGGRSRTVLEETRSLVLMYSPT